MTDQTPEEPVTEDSATPEEYQPDLPEVSPDTGTVYEGEGEPAATPQDVETEDEP